MTAGLPALGWVDWALLAVLVLSVAVGVWRGLLFEVLSLLGWLAAYIAAQFAGPVLAAWLPVGQAGGALNQAAGLVAAFVLALLLWALMSRLLRTLVHATPLQMADRVLGALFGLLRGAVLLLVAATVVSLTPAVRSPAWQDSRGAVWLGALLHGLKPVLPEAVARHLPA
ncbi:MAG TPA: CvpA family protein [Burkholderiaceae bacterium]|nr:CvpA family protein [Burkholderiaceae bacterium]